MPKRKPPQIILKGDKAEAAKWLPFAYKLLGKMPRALMRKTYLPVPGVRILVEKARRLHRVTIEVVSGKFIAAKNGASILVRMADRIRRRFGVLKSTDEISGLAIWPTIIRGATKADTFVWGFDELSNVHVFRVSRKGALVKEFEAPFSLNTGGAYAVLYADEMLQTYLFHMGGGAFGFQYYNEEDSDFYFRRTLDGGNTFDAITPDNPFNDGGVVGIIGYPKRNLLLGLSLGRDSGVFSDYQIYAFSSQDKGDTWNSTVFSNAEAVLYSGDVSHDLDATELVESFSAFVGAASMYGLEDGVVLIGPIFVGDGSTYVMRAIFTPDGGATFSARATGIPIFDMGFNDNPDPNVLQPQAFRRPLVLPDERFLFVEPTAFFSGVGVWLSDPGCFNISLVADSFPVSSTALFGLPEPVRVRGEFKVVIPIREDGSVIAYINTDDTYTTWVPAGTIGVHEAGGFWNPDIGEKFQYPFHQVVGLEDAASILRPGDTG